MNKPETKDIPAFISWIIIGIGISLRLDQYLFNRSLWVDEAFLAANFIDTPFWELLTPPLEYAHNLVVPPGFLAITQLIVETFGNSDMLLRLFPLLCALAALGLFYLVAVRYLSARAVPYALLLFVLSDSLIYYASEFKQYSSDVLVVLLLLLLTAWIKGQGLNARSLLVAAFSGALAVWFSHPSVYVLAGMGLYFVVASAASGQWRSVAKLSAVGVILLVSFLLLYHFSTPGGVENTANGRFLVQIWKGWGAFMPSPLLPDGLEWIAENYVVMFAYPAELAAPAVAGLLFAVGGVALYRQRRWAFYVLTLPIPIAAGASYFEVYPFMGRTILFLLPAIYLLLGEGLSRLQLNIAQGDWARRSSLLFRLTMVIVLLDLPVYRQQISEEIRPVLSAVQQQRQPGEVIYLYHWVEPAFRYYADSLGFDYGQCRRIAPIPPGVYEKEIDYFRRQRGLEAVGVFETQCVLGAAELFEQSWRELGQLIERHRVWFVFSHIHREQKLRFLYYLNQQGTQQKQIIKKGASAYLYEF